jgi:cell division protein FtsI/penicillin-binding protein 2
MATWLSGISRQQRIIRQNVFIACGFFLLAFAGIIGVLIKRQLVDYRFYHELALSFQQRIVALPAMRGRLLDRNHRVLALDDQRMSLYADPTLVKHPAFLAERLAPVVERPAAEVFAALTRRATSVVVADELPARTADAIVQRGYDGLTVTAAGERFRVGCRRPHPVADPKALDRLGEILALSPAETTRLFGQPAPVTDEAPPPPPTVLWHADRFTRAQVKAAKACGVAGLVTKSLGQYYTLSGNPQAFSPKSAHRTARVLDRLLPLTDVQIERRLRFRPRFSWVKRRLSAGALTQVNQLQGTLYIVEPGKIITDAASVDDAEVQLDEAVDNLHKLLNETAVPSTRGKKDERQLSLWARICVRLGLVRPAKGPAAPEIITKATIRQALQPGAAPGALGVFLSEGTPSIRLSRFLDSQPIPGVIYGLPGIGLQQERRRQYPFATLASATLGYVSHDHGRLTGAFGLESTQEKTLRGVDGQETKEIDARHLTIPERSRRREPQDGRDVILTLDLDIQQAAETALREAVTAAKARGGSCTVIDPKSGEILALATYPAWDANDPGHSPVDLMHPVVSNFYEPGSTFKLVAVLAALEEGIIRDGQQITYCSGALPIGRHTIGEAHNAHGAVDCKRLLEQSCNIAAAHLALRLGPERFIKWCEALGFGERTHIELAHESPGLLNRSNVRAKITLATMGFGQSVAVTPLQLAAAYSVVANNGEWVQPHLVKGRMRADGTVEHPVVPRRTVCSPETATRMKAYFENVVVEGTGGGAAVAGYRVAGKTGTAQKAEGKRIRSGKYIGSFIGFLPVNDPRLTILAVIDEPKTSIYGGAVASPIVRDVGTRAMQYMNVPPTQVAPAPPAP